MNLIPVPQHRDQILAAARLKSLKASINDPDKAITRWQLSQLRDDDPNLPADGRPGHTRQG